MVTRTGLKVFDHLQFALDPHSLKRDILMFDKLAIDFDQIDRVRPAVEWLFTLHDRDPSRAFKHLEEGLEKLEKAGLIDVINYYDTRCDQAFLPRINELETEAARHLETATRRGPYQISLPDGSRPTIDPLLSWHLCQMRMDLLHARNRAVVASTTSSKLIPFPSGKAQMLFDPKLDEGLTRKTTVLRVTMNRLPMPSRETSWEAVLDFKNDQKNIRRLSRLRSRMVNMAASNLDEEDLQTKLEADLQDYRAFMEFKKIQMEEASYESTIVGPVEILEDFVMLRFGNFLRRIFRIAKDDVTLIEAEFEAPGRELAFVSAVHDGLGPTAQNR